MKLLFLSIGDIPSIKHHEIYPDLLRELIKNGHDVYVVCSREKRLNLPTQLIDENGAKLLKVRIGNITKTNIIEKGISTVFVGKQYKAAIKKYFSDIKFDFVMYSTPPITLAGLVKYIKKRDNAKTYLLLKDIFPQNAVDIGMMTTNGPKSLIYKYFRSKEQKLYAVSDKIGSMSKANVDYVINHNPRIDPRKVEICPNCLDIQEINMTDEKRKQIREKYGIPIDKTVFVYGGNLGAPQGIPFVIDCLNSQIDKCKAFFLIVGDGTEYARIERFINEKRPHNVKLLKWLQKEDYDYVLASCDVGMIFLDYRFTIPNYPSRVLTYMQAKLPIIACTDSITDISKDIIDGKFGWSCLSNDVKGFDEIIDTALTIDLTEKKKNSYKYLCDHFSCRHAYDVIAKSFM